MKALVFYKKEVVLHFKNSSKMSTMRKVLHLRYYGGMTEVED